MPSISRHAVIHYIATPGDTNDYHVATWTGIAGDEFYRNGADAECRARAEHASAQHPTEA